MKTDPHSHLADFTVAVRRTGALYCGHSVIRVNARVAAHGLGCISSGKWELLEEAIRNCFILIPSTKCNFEKEYQAVWT